MSIQIEKELIEIFTEFIGEITETFSFKDLDSFVTIQIILSIEMKYGIQFENTEIVLEKYNTFSDLASIISEKKILQKKVI